MLGYTLGNFRRMYRYKHWNNKNGHTFDHINGEAVQNRQGQRRLTQNPDSIAKEAETDGENVSLYFVYILKNKSGGQNDKRDEKQNCRRHDVKTSGHGQITQESISGSEADSWRFRQDIFAAGFAKQQTGSRLQRFKLKPEAGKGRFFLLAQGNEKPGFRIKLKGFAAVRHRDFPSVRPYF